ncbi:hypothetical protein BGZ94_002032, partial [Podila epigama]
ARPASSEQRREAEKYFKEALKQELIAVGDPERGTGPRIKYVLSGTIQTNGQQVKIQAFHLRHRWPKKKEGNMTKLASSSSSSSGPGLPSNFAEPGPSSSFSKPGPSSILSELGSSSSFAEPGPLGASMEIDNPASLASSFTPMSMASVPDEASMGRSSSSGQALLLSGDSNLSKPDHFYNFIEYIEKVIPDTDTMKKEFPDQTEFRVTAIDPGVKKTACSATIDTKKPGQAIIIDVPREISGSEGQTINQIEQKLQKFKLPPPLSSSSPNPATFGDLFNQAKDRMETHIRCLLSADENLRSFYGSAQLKYWRYQKEQGVRADTGKAINSILQTAQGGTRETRRGILAIGDGKFGSLPGIVDKSATFRRQLALEAGGRGLLVCLVHEFRSSRTCSQCGGLTKAKGRSLTCLNPTCGGKRTDAQNKMFCLDPSKGPMSDRDHNAAVNLTRASLQQAREQTWPVFLQRSKKIDLEEDVSAKFTVLETSGFNEAQYVSWEPELVGLTEADVTAALSLENVSSTAYV